MRQLQLDQQPQQQQQQQTPQQQQTVHGSSSSGGGASDPRQSSACMSAGARSGSGPGASLAPWPAACRNPYAECDPPMPAQVNSYTCQKSFKVGRTARSSRVSLSTPLCSAVTAAGYSYQRHCVQRPFSTSHADLHMQQLDPGGCWNSDGAQCIVIHCNHGLAAACADPQTSTLVCMPLAGPPAACGQPGTAPQQAHSGYCQ